MINKTQKKALLKSLGKKHIAKIKSFAEEKGVVKENGEEFSQSTFSAVLNGRLDHGVIEDLIFSAADYHYQMAETQKNSRKEFVTKVNNA